MTVLRITGTLDALSPIQHGGDEKTGSTPVLRSLTHWDSASGQHVRLPFLSGNAIRGVWRRLAMRALVDAVGYAVQAPKLHHALYSGGVLESTDETTGVIDLERRRWVRDTFPPLALFGTVLGNQMVPGCLRVDHALPVCAETRAVLPPALQADPRAQHGVRTFTDVAFATRRDDLRAERASDEQAQQMLVEFEAFIPGTRFAHGATLVYASPLEAACLGHTLALWAEQPFVGGKAGSGYGRVQATYSPALDPAPYTTYLAEQAAMLQEALAQLDGWLGARPARAAAPA